MSIKYIPIEKLRKIKLKKNKPKIKIKIKTQNISDLIKVKVSKR